MARKVVLAGACRTAIGTMGGSLSTTPAADLGAIVIKEALNRAGVAPEQVDHVYMGCVIQAGMGQNVARQAALKGTVHLPLQKKYKSRADGSAQEGQQDHGNDFCVHCYPPLGWVLS